MAKKSLITIDGVYRKNKKCFVTVGKIHRKLKKAFLTIGSVYRPCWSGGELQYYGFLNNTLTVTQKNDYSAGSNENFAFFTSSASTVDAFDTSLTKHSAPNLYTRAHKATTTLGDNVIFAGGDDNSSATTQATFSIRAIDSDFTVTTMTNLNDGRGMIAPATLDDLALFCGGYGAATGYSECLDVYNSDLTKYTAKDMPTRGQYSGDSVGNYAVFYNEFNNGTYENKMYSIDSDLTISLSSLSFTTAKRDVAAKTIGDFIMFAGGRNTKNNAVYKTVTAINSDLTMLSGITSLSESRYSMAKTTLDDYILFIGGISSSNNQTNIVDVYDKDLTKIIDDTLVLQQAKGYEYCATSVGKYALCTQGYVGTIEAFVA